MYDPVVRGGPILSSHDLRTLQVHGEVAIEDAIVDNIAFNNLTFVPERDCELLMAVCGIVHHDVPKDGSTADRDHRLRLHFRLLHQSSANAPGKNSDFHDYFPLKSVRKRPPSTSSSLLTQ